MTAYPEYAEVDGKRYKINTDYRDAIRCFEVIDDPDICDEERAMAIVFILFGFIPEEHIEDFVRIAGDFLRCGETQENQAAKEKDMDLVSDEKYIVASFLSDYKIDLPHTQMHFWQFIQLIQGLTDSSALSRVREIRNYDASEIKDPKERQKIFDAKKAVELPIKLSKEEKEMIAEFEKNFG